MYVIGSDTIAIPHAPLPNTIRLPKVSWQKHAWHNMPMGQLEKNIGIITTLQRID